MVYKIENSEIADCWEDLVKLVYTNGHLVDDERGSTTKELLNVVTKIKNPLGKQDGGFFGIGEEYNTIENVRVPEGYFWDGDRITTYSEQFLKCKIILYLFPTCLIVRITSRGFKHTPNPTLLNALI